ncbi:hypothetical protein AB4393_23470 [Vibrio splendidus]
MKELVNAITQATANRLKAPFLGSFILAWLIVNRVFAVEFLFNSSEGKIELVKGSSFNLTTDLVAPLALAVLYTYGLPFIQFFIDKTKHKLIDKKRIEEHHVRRADEYKAQMVASEYQAKSSLSYQQDKLNRDLDNWGQQREEYESRIENLNTQLESGTEQLTLITAELEKSKEELKLNVEKVEFLTKEREEQKRQIAESSEYYIRYEESKKELSSHASKNEELELELKSMKGSSEVLENIVLALHDSIESSDQQIASNLKAELLHRKGIAPEDIAVITKSYQKRVKDSRNKLTAYRPMLANIRKRHTEQYSDEKSFSAIKLNA